MGDLSGEISAISVRLATIQDVAELMSLNEAWQYSRLDDPSKGFLSYAFNEDVFLKAIENSDCVVAVDCQIVVGYYLTYHSSKGLSKKTYKSAVAQLKQRLAAEHRVALGAQAVININYLGKGIRQQLFIGFKALLRDRFDFVLSRIKSTNLKAQSAHDKDGWRLVYEDNEFDYVLLRICE